MDLRAYIASHENFPKLGVVFRDIAPLLASPTALQYVVDAFANRYRMRVDSIAALDARGFLFGAPLALSLGVPLRMVRKRGKLPGAVHQVSYALEYGEDCIELQSAHVAPHERVLIIDDLLATGGTARAACSLIERAGGVVAGVACVIELNGLGGRDVLAGYDVQTLVPFDEESIP